MQAQRNKLIPKYKYFLFLFTIILFVSCTKESDTPVEPKNETTLDKNEANSAFTYLNKVRQNPSAYSLEIGVDLSSVAPRQTLVWNDILQKVAEDKAYDMASRDYFSHQTPEGYGINYFMNKAGYTMPSEWLKDPSANNFESIAAAYKTGVVITGIDLVRQMIVDKDVPDLGHRKHLLGIDTWNANMKEIGVGFARNPKTKYQNYICVIIAKHQN